MTKKLLVIIVIASILTIGFVLLAIGVIGPQNSLNKKNSLGQINVGTPVPKTASLYFSPPLLKVNPQQSNATQVSIIVNTGISKISGAQLELTYDPQILRNVTVSTAADSFFGNSSDYSILFNDVDSANGRISFAIAARNRSLEKQGSGAIATISFTVDPNVESQTTNVKFAPTTLVTTFGAHQTVLKEAAGITLLFDKNLSMSR